MKPAKGKAVTLIVPEGLMDDIVRPMWGTEVIAVGEYNDEGHLVLVTIDQEKA